MINKNKNENNKINRLRKSPNIPSKNFSLGTVKNGLDNTPWIVSKRSDDIKTWKRQKNNKRKYNTVISPYLSGGIGNQLFQIAAAYSYYLDNKNCKYIIECPKLLGPGHKQNINNIYNSLPTIITEIFPNIKCTNKLIKWDNIIKQKRDKFYDNVPLKKYIRRNEKNKLVGVFASHMYFKKNEDEIKKLFKFSNIIVNSANNFENIIKNDETISLHFRRGDMLKWHNQNKKMICIIDLDYYYKAIDLFIKNHTGYLFVIFNEKNDDNWIQEYIIPYLEKKKQKYLHIDYNVSASLSLYLITKCKNNIISKSTFSFWGAFLNDNKNKIVYAPQIYNSIDNEYKLAIYLRGNIMSSKNEERLPNEWIKIDTTCI